MAFWIVTDVCCDLPASYITKQENFLVAPMSYQIDGEVHEIDPLDENLSHTSHQFYEKLSNGSTSSTFQVTQQNWTDLLTPICQQGQDILVLAFSSALSGTYESATLAAKELSEQFKERRILVVDSLCASLGEGLFVDHVLAFRNSDKTLEEAHQYALELVPKITLWFTVNDLHFLRRGGRVSATSAYVGSVLKIKPVLNVDPKGRLIARDKVQGRKRSLNALLERAKEFAHEPEKQTMYISHGDCLQDATWLANKLKEELLVPDVMISFVGPVVGSHSGPGTVALFFVGKDGAGRLDAPDK